MKMIVRLNLSFGLLLLCILAVTAAVIYPLLQDTLIESQRKEMREQGSILMHWAIPAVKLTAAQPTTEPTKMENLVPASSGTNAVVVAPYRQVLYSTVSAEQANEWIDASNSSPDTGIWQGKDGPYLIETLTSAGETNANANVTEAVTTIMATPLSKIKAMQLALFGRMMIILSVGGILAFLLSMLITKRIVTPLAKLKAELKKVEARRFSEVKLVETGGEIGEVARSVYQLAGELEQYERTQKHFFQNASHELKTPLMAIQGYAEGIKDGIFTGESADKGLDVIANECERLKQIVTEMILLAKLESEDGIFHMDRVPVEDLIAKTVERINPLLVKKGLNIEVTCVGSEQNRYIYADREKLLQALINVAGNATRYAKQTIRVHASAADTGVDIEIADDGEGIPDHMLPRLFGRFSKGKDGETGLGLAISRAIVERCRGQITARNRPNGGAAFVLRLPSA